MSKKLESNTVLVFLLFLALAGIVALVVIYTLVQGLLAAGEIVDWAVATYQGQTTSLTGALEHLVKTAVGIVLFLVAREVIEMFVGLLNDEGYND